MRSFQGSKTGVKYMFRFHSRKGSITIYLLISFMAMALFIGLFLDLARIRVAQNQLRRVANSAARSILADYNKDLKSGYFLFSASPNDFQAEFARYLRLNTVSTEAGTFDLLGCRYENSQVQLFNPLNEREVIRQQILEDMKYKAPVALAANLIEKLRPIGNMCRVFDENSKKRKSVNRINEDIQSINSNRITIEELKVDFIEKQSELSMVIERIEQIERKEKKTESDSRELVRLYQKRDKLETELLKLKEQITFETDTAHNLCQKINRQFVELETGDDLSFYSSAQELEGGISGSIDMLKTELDQYKGVLRESLKKIKGNIDASAQKLSEPVKNIDIDRVGLPAAEEANRLVENSWSEQVRGDYDKSRLEAAVGEERIAGLVLKADDIDDNKKRFEKKYGPVAEDKVSLIRGIFKLINNEEFLVDLRDDVYINEYCLSYFSNFTVPRGGENYQYGNSEVEYVLHGGDNPRGLAVAQLYAYRFALDAAAYFAFSKFPVDILSRSVYAFVMGAVQGSLDTFRLLQGKDVAVAEMMPENINPLRSIRLNYTDHLRLFLLLMFGEESQTQKLDRIIWLIGKRNNVDTSGCFTRISGEVEVSIKMWFIPLALANSSGPFGSRFEGGRCYIRKSVEYGY